MVEPTRRVARRTTPLERSATKTVYFRASITSWLIGRGPPKLAALVQTVTRLKQIGLYHTVFHRQKRESLWRMFSEPRQYRPCISANRSTEDRAFQLLGLGWSAAAKETIKKAARALAAEQRPDGGWAQIPTLSSDAYATGQALVALQQSGALMPADPMVQRGNRFLMQSQLGDGSWFVTSRAIPLQPHFESGFPHGRDQFISAAATNWATMALSLAIKSGS
jgi:hypothetical protein